jgi:hypothetical protein
MMRVPIGIPSGFPGEFARLAISRFSLVIAEFNLIGVLRFFIEKVTRVCSLGLCLEFSRENEIRVCR